MSITPMMQQYQEAKAACPGAILLFRMGDFYELFFEDAEIVARELNLSLTSRDKGENAIPMAGFPHHSLDNYLAKLIQNGHRVAIADQVEDPKLAKGLVKREVTRIVSAGTLTEESLLDPKANNYLASISETKKAIGLAWLELSTGRFLAMETTRERLNDELARIEPTECLISEDFAGPLYSVKGQTMMTRRPVWMFQTKDAEDALKKHFGTHSLEGFGWDRSSPALGAAGAILQYLRETQRDALPYLEPISPYESGETLLLDAATRRSLELTKTLRDGRRQGSLLGILDQTVTAMGSRMLADWLANPLRKKPLLDERLDAVAELKQNPTLIEQMQERLKGIYDIERLVARVTSGRASPRDLNHLGKTLNLLPKIKAKLAGRKSSLLNGLQEGMSLLPEMTQKLRDALEDDCPLTSREGGFIRARYSAEIDQLRELAAGGKQWIAKYQADESQRSGIPNLKVGYNKVFGYYLEVTHAHRDRVPSEYIRKQTLKNAERYITPELKEYEEKVLSATDRAKELEYHLFLALRAEVADQGPVLQQNARILAQLDVLISFAELARQRGYCRPELTNSPQLTIEQGRHPVLDITEPEGSFVPNDAQMDPEGDFLLLITGPNMAGKSTYIRQVALITLMAQMGSFVPAQSAMIGLADRIFARVGASDELSRGQSTFMVEMTETARILHQSTANSLVILDEIGRGTSTYDGVSLAWAVVEHLHDYLGCRTLFATHYHELTDLANERKGVKNLSVAVQEWEERIVFLHQIVEGPADKSYGIHVARLAGVPHEVIDRAEVILQQLENTHQLEEHREKLANLPSTPKHSLQLTLFGSDDHPILDEMRELDLDRISDESLLNQIRKWQSELKSRLPANS
ncbi:DNA mismatch repair protein MutS [Planctomycetales bacterium 10988]|nr:DNA mismatch repair protein MutS [Planctomycetales bacterium 10988]